MTRRAIFLPRPGRRLRRRHDLWWRRQRHPCRRRRRRHPYGGDGSTDDGGNDVFRYLAAGDGGDFVYGFTDGSDRIDLSAIDAIAGGGDDAFGFVAGETTATLANSVSWHRTAFTTTADFTISLYGARVLDASDFVM